MLEAFFLRCFAKWLINCFVLCLAQVLHLGGLGILLPHWIQRPFFSVSAKVSSVGSKFNSCLTVDNFIRPFISQARESHSQSAIGGSFEAMHSLLEIKMGLP